jgi:DNA-binding transcriptional ArsR family regulator
MDQALFDALADPTRRQLVTWLAVQPATATELAERLPISRQAITKHLNVLGHARLLKRERSGREVRYGLDAERLRAVTDWIEGVSVRWEMRLARLKKYVEEGDRHGRGS